MERAAGGGGLGDAVELGGRKRGKLEAGEKILQTAERYARPDGGDRSLGIHQNKRAGLVDFRLPLLLEGDLEELKRAGDAV